MTAFTKRMPAGIPGAITRPWETTTAPVQITGPANASNAPQNYGVGVVIDASTAKARLPIASDTVISGFLPRPYPGGAAQFQATLGITPIDYDHVGDILRRGYMAVLLGGSTASAKEGRVYVRKANASGGKPIGGVEAAPDLGGLASVKSGTGNGTFTPDVTTPVASNAVEGVYTATFSDATHIVLSDPNGTVLGTYVIGGSTGNTVTLNDQIKGVVTQGSVVFIAGDSFAITTAFNTIRLDLKSWFVGAAYTDPTFGAVTEIAFNI